MEKIASASRADGHQSDSDKAGARPKSSPTPDDAGTEAEVDGDAGGDDRYKQWRKAGADLRKAIASLTSDNSKVCQKKCAKVLTAAVSPDSKKQGLNSPTAAGVSSQLVTDTGKNEPSQANEDTNPAQNIKMLKTRVQEISAKYKLNLHNNETQAGKSRRKLHTHAELTRNRLSVEIETSSESELDVDIHAARHSSPKLHKGKKPIQSWKASNEEIHKIDSLKPDVSLSDSLPSSSKGNSAEPSPVKTKTCTKTAAEVKRKLFSGESPTGTPEKNPTLGEFLSKNKTVLHTPLLLTQTDSVLNLADISSTSENDEKQMSSPDESSTVTNTPLCTPAKDEESVKAEDAHNNKEEPSQEEQVVSDSELLAEQLPDLVIENFAGDSGTEDNSKSITLSQEEISSLPDIESGHGSTSGEEDADADDEFECDCCVCQQRNTDVQPRTDWLLDEEVFEVAESPSQGRVEYFSFSGHGPGGGLLAPYSLDMESITPLDVLITRNSSDVLELMFQNVIMQMLSVYPELLSDQAPPPASVADIEKLGKVKITEEKIAEDASCPICLCPFEQKDEALKMPCDHVFHGLCLRAWLNKSATCPVCRWRLSGTLRT